jgi:hypothetical protein
MWIKKVIEATQEIATYFQTEKIVLLTESDLKVHLSNKIREKFDDNITVNTESPWHDTYETNSIYYIDITAFDREKLNLANNSNTNRKGYRYDDDALAIELKYFRYEVDINRISEDFSKMRLLIKAPKNECFIIAAANTPELYNSAKIFMENQINQYRNEFDKRVKVFLFDKKNFEEIK